MMKGFIQSYKLGPINLRAMLQTWKSFARAVSSMESNIVTCLLTSWLMESGGSMPYSQGLSNDPYTEPNQY